MLLATLLLIIGLVLLYYGAEWLVNGASNLALSFGISPLIVGLTIVAAGTSAPELFVSVLAALQGNPDIALGNVVGSNIANIGLIVGISAVIVPLTVSRTIIRRDYPVLFFSTLLLFAVAYTGAEVSRFDGALLLGATIAYLAWCGREALQESRRYRLDAGRGERAEKPPVLKELLQIVAGLIGLVIGARLMVDNAVLIAEHFNVPQIVIGTTVVAIGTSLPELATSIVAALKKEADICLGNIVGSNIFNGGIVLGTTSLIHPVAVNQQALSYDLPASGLMMLLPIPFMFSRRGLNRGVGALLLVSYAAYVGGVIYISRVVAAANAL